MSKFAFPSPKFIKQWFRRIFIFIVITAIVVTLGRNWTTIQSFSWHIKPLGILLAIIAYIGFFMIRGIAWVWTLNLLDVPLGYSIGLKTYLYTFVSRYIPGGIWTFITLNTLAHTLGQSKRVFTFALVFNTVLLIFVDVIYVLPFAFLLLGVWGYIIYSCLIFLFPFLTRYSLSTFSNIKLIPKSKNFDTLTKSQHIYRLFNVTIAHQTLQLMAYFLLISSVLTFDRSETMYLTLAYAISWLIGFLVLVVPQGLGVREGVFLILAAPILTSEIAIALSVVLRLLTIFSELIVFVVFVVYDYLTRTHHKNTLG